MKITISINPLPSGNTFNLLIDVEGDKYSPINLPGDMTYERITEHTNNALRRVCNDLDQTLKLLRHPVK